MAIDEATLKRIYNDDPVVTPEWLAKQANITGSELHDIALKFHNGDGVTKNRDKARQWYEKAFEKGCVVASRNVGLLYEFGHGIPETRLTNLLSLIYSYDYGVSKDYVKAAQCYQQAIDKGYANAQIDLDRLLQKPDISAENLNTIAVMYIYGKGVIVNDVVAMALLIKAKDKGSIEAYRNIAHVYQWSHSSPRCLFAAAKNYALAIEKGYTNAINDLEGLKNASDMTAQMAIKIACMFKNGTDDGVPKNEVNARKWYDLARELAIRHQTGTNASPELVDVANYYYQCSKNKDNQAQTLLESLPLTSNQWCTLGDEYYYGEKNAAKMDHVFAYRCYQKVLALDPKHVRGNYLVGWMLEHGQGGLVVDKATAKQHYEQAALFGCFEARISLVLMTHSNLTTDQHWYDLGNEYDKGVCGRQRDYVNARACYEIAIKKNGQHAASLHALGLLFQYGRGTEIDLAKAKAYYERGAQANHAKSQDQLAILENPILSCINNQDYQSHVIRVEYDIEKIMRDFSWVHNPRYAPIVTREDMFDLLDEMQVCKLDFVGNLLSYKACLDAMGTSHFSVDKLNMAEKDLIESGTNVFNNIKKYYLQLIRHTNVLLGANAPRCDDEIVIISNELDDFQHGLTQIADLANRRQNQHAPLSRFFSTAQYIATYTASNQHEPTCVNTTPLRT